MEIIITEKDLFPETLGNLLTALSEAGFFEEGLLAGSWVFVLYGIIYSLEFPIRTLDVDFAVRAEPDLKGDATNIEDVITSLGYLAVTERSGWRKYTKEGLGVEFITNRKGSKDGVDLIKFFNITALRLPFLDLLFDSPIDIVHEDFKLRIPGAESLFLHKLVTSHRRIEASKEERDLEQCRYLVKIIDFSKVTKIMQDRRWSRESLKKIKAACRQIDLPILKIGLG